MITTVTDRIHRRPKRTLLLVLAFVLLSVIVGGGIADSLDNSSRPATGDSAVAIEQIETATGHQVSPGVVLLVDDPSESRMAEFAAELSAVPGIANAAVGGTSLDGQQAILVGTLSADATDKTVADLVDKRFGNVDGVALGGEVIAENQIGETVGRDLGRAELFAFPLLLVLSFLFFRGRATVLPMLVGATTVLGTFLALSGINQFFGLSVFALNLVIGLGLGLAIDYTLFLVSRFREELQAQGAGPGAVRATMLSAGRTVVFSAITVSVALITLTVFPLSFLQSMGIAGSVVALVAAVAAIIICAAFFSMWGAKLAVRQKNSGEPAQGRWYRLSAAVMRRPVIITILAASIMVAMAAPALRVEWTPVDSTVIPKDQSARTVSDALDQRFPGQDTTPTVVVVTAPQSAGTDVGQFAESLTSLRGVQSVSPARSLDADTWRIDLDVAGNSSGAQARGVVETIRDRESPFPLVVGGSAAEFIDQQSAIAARLAVAAALLALLTFVVLWLMTGSVVLPLTAIVMNVLTVGASLGVLTFIYQDGRWEGLLGYTANGGIEPSNFLIAAAVVFALSTDYGVFLLGRIKEARDSGLGERDSVATGLAHTGGVVTAAAILLAVAIGAFSTSSISFIQQIGIATAVGVLLDAFVVRTLLVPALMGLLGKWNWWSPRWLRRWSDRMAPIEPPVEQSASPDPRREGVRS
jgi:RND superfamily putative drug exporter